MPLQLNWELCESYKVARKKEKCIYAFRAGNEVLYVGKAKHFGTRYSPGYRYLITALLNAGHELYIAELPNEHWKNVIAIEQTLIAEWKPLTVQRRIDTDPYYVNTQLPWNTSKCAPYRGRSAKKYGPSIK
jgi:excinuclease UvrABC nuclease subunit